MFSSSLLTYPVCPTCLFQQHDLKFRLFYFQVCIYIFLMHGNPFFVVSNIYSSIYFFFSFLHMILVWRVFFRIILMNCVARWISFTFFSPSLMHSGNSLPVRHLFLNFCCPFRTNKRFDGNIGKFYSPPEKAITFVNEGILLLSWYIAEMM